ncbi:PREDICTED: putative sodium-coupled neutral amino acid transporter 9 isoform X1 [Acromyrmex echinatior]|uniref:Putative amino acid permease F13H10.3 n=2 Tax=Acromyrmex echinatior TaxID=103372 RepID=F4WL87_ACREC|nr:PREDICTED: putative sodium-coupled neutral amino acid transporter 9 isoform X1 [Acromyrmex echinatior]EGI65050.1 Putative amino acid permease F13H10.3 [Acromyrmex echinatior]
MYKIRVYPGSDSSLTRDSGSESTPLLSSDSRTSPELVIFDDSDTSDLDPSPASCSLIYGSIDSSYNTILATPKRSISSTKNSELFVSTMANSPCTISEKNYEPRNIDLTLMNENSNTKKAHEIDFVPGPLQFQPDIIQTSCKDLKPKQSSLVTIFSIWNTILGSSLLTMPWGITMAGFFPGIILNLLMSGLCLYTAYRLVVAHAYHGGGSDIEVLDLCRIYLGKWAEHTARIFSIAVLLGATIAYWILMANFLYNSVNFIYDSIAGSSTHRISENISYKEVLCPKEFQDNNTIVIEKTYDMLGPTWDLRNTVPMFLALLIFPLLNFNSTTFFTKFNSLGTVSVMYLIIFVVIKSASWGINMDQVEWTTSWVIRPTFPALTGLLAMSFFIHNIVINIMQNNRNQEKNGRDLTIAYFLVTLTYIIVGVGFFMCFPLPKSCIEDNLLNNFQKWDGLTIGARMVLLFQLVTVYPLLAYVLRIQLLSWIWKRAPNRSLVLFINLVLVSICIIFATFVPYIGTIVRYTGALSGLIYVFTFPNLLHLSILKKKGKLSIYSILFHLAIPVIGFLNLIAQFFITDH